MKLLLYAYLLDNGDFDELVHTHAYNLEGDAPAIVIHDGQPYRWVNTTTTVKPGVGELEREEPIARYVVEPPFSTETNGWIDELLDGRDVEARAADRLRLVAEALEQQEEKPASYPSTRARDYRYNLTDEKALQNARDYIALYNRDRTLMEISDETVESIRQALDALEEQARAATRWAAEMFVTFALEPRNGSVWADGERRRLLADSPKPIHVEALELSKARSVE